MPTLLDMPEDTDIAIVNGSKIFKEKLTLCNIAQPNYGIITNIKLKAHLEGFGSLEGIKIGKGSINT